MPQDNASNQGSVEIEFSQRARPAGEHIAPDHAHRLRLEEAERLAEIERKNREQESEIRRKDHDALFQRWREAGRELVIALMALLIAVIAGYVIFSTRYSSDDKQKAWAALVAALTGFGGYVAGRAVSK